MRINPDELHCDDYDFAEEIYPSVTNRIRDKHPHFLNGFAGNLTVSTFLSRDHEACLFYTEHKLICNLSKRK